MSSSEQNDLTDVFRMVDKLLIDKDVVCALVAGRAFLCVKDYNRSLHVFQHIRERVDPLREDYYIILGNIAYSLLGLGRYDEAINYLLRVKSVTEKNNDGKTFFAWHSVALACAYYKRGKEGDMDEFKRWLEESKKKFEYHENVEWFAELYPEIKEYL